MEELRIECYERDGGKCVECGKPLRFEAGYWDSMHMAHIKNKRMYGDTISNVRSLCLWHHLAGDHNCGGKPVPKKVKD
jgi:hypothetical protein